MKKFLGILVLGFLLNGCETYYAGGSGSILSTSNDQILLGWDDYYGSDTQTNKDVAARHCRLKNKFAYYFKDKSEGQNAAIYLCSASILNVSPISGKNLVWTNFNPNSEISKKHNVVQAKNTCKDLGLPPGSDKFIDCTIKLTAAYIQTQQQAIQQVSSGSSGTMTIYDPVRDSENAMRRGMALVNGTCTVANYLNC
jgi:hypothetical protein